MRHVFALLLLLAQAVQLPPAYPRPGATVLFENARVVVWNIAWLKQQYPLHRHRYDLVGVYYAPGDRAIISPDGTKRPVTTKAWDTAFQKSGVTHIEEGTSDAPLRAVFIELKEDAPLGQVETAAATSALADAFRQKPLLDNDRTTGWLLLPGATLSSHRHQRDAVVIAFAGQTPTVTFVNRDTVHASESSAPSSRVYIFELK
jgi:hypothetical protein